MAAGFVCPGTGTGRRVLTLALRKPDANPLCNFHLASGRPFMKKPRRSGASFSHLGMEAGKEG